MYMKLEGAVPGKRFHTCGTFYYFNKPTVNRVFIRPGELMFPVFESRAPDDLAREDDQL